MSEIWPFGILTDSRVEGHTNTTKAITYQVYENRREIDFSFLLRASMGKRRVNCCLGSFNTTNYKKTKHPPMNTPVKPCHLLL